MKDPVKLSLACRVAPAAGLGEGFDSFFFFFLATMSLHIPKQNGTQKNLPASEEDGHL